MSESLLWQLQENYYDVQSLNAWSQVPFYSTNRMMFVGMNAQLVQAFLLDYADQLNEEEPIFILELGGGSGCFAYRFLNEFLELKESFPQLKDFAITYVLSDFTRSNIEAHLRNPRLRKYIESGVLDLSVYSPQTPGSVHLEVSKIELNSGSLRNPLLVIANYFFDTIKHDAFRTDRGRLYETKFTLYHESNDATGTVSTGIVDGEIDAQADRSSAERRDGAVEKAESVVDVPVRISDVRLEETYEEIKLPYYQDLHLDSILEFYKENCEQASIIFPIGGLRSLANLQSLTTHGVVLFASDKGFASLESSQFAGLQPQSFAEHGAFSFDVNFDAVARYVANLGGSALIDSGDHSSLSFLFGTTFSAKLPLASNFFRNYIQKLDVCNASYNLEEVTFAGCESKVALARPYLTVFTSIVQCSNYEPFIFDGAFARLFDRLVPELSSLDGEQRTECRDLVLRTARNLFNVANKFDDLAALCEFSTECGFIDLTYSLAKDAIELLGPSRIAYDQAALACERLGLKKEAFDYFSLSLALVPDHDWARQGMERNRV